MFHIALRKVGGIRFLTLGRISVSFSVSSPDAWRTRVQARMDSVMLHALIEAL